MDSAEIQRLAEDIDTAISASVQGILMAHGVAGVEAASVCIAVAGLQQGRVDTMIHDPEFRALFEVFRNHGKERFAALKKRSMN